MSRWTATVIYRSEVGAVPVVHQIEELDEIGALVEAGPDWNCIVRIEIVLADQSGAMTVEHAETL